MKRLFLLQICIILCVFSFSQTNYYYADGQQIYWTTDNSLPEGKTMIEFHDVTGRLVLSEEIKSANTSINISSLKQGVYMYRIVNGDNVIARDRIVKE